MSEVNVKATFLNTDGVNYVKHLDIFIPDYLIHARLISLDEESTNVSYELYVARNNQPGRTPTVIRDWTMFGFYQPRMHGASLAHRGREGGTLFTLGSVHEHAAKDNLIAAIFDSLLGYSNVSDKKVIDQYVKAAHAMYRAGLGPNSITDQYRASIITPHYDLDGTRVWFVNAKEFMFGHTTWTLTIDGFSRITHRDREINTTHDKILQLFIQKMSEVIEANKVM